MVPNLKSYQIYLKICTLFSLKALSTNLILIFSDFIPQIYIWGICSQTKISLNLLKKCIYTSQFEGAKYEYGWF